MPSRAQETSSTEPRLGIAVGIATSGRAAILAETLADLERQTLRPERVLVLYGVPSDIAGLPARYPAVHFAEAEGGLCAKRNRILDEAAGLDLILFIDDDFLLDPDYLRVTEEAFRGNGAMVAATGTVLADGAKGPGLSVEQGRRALAAGFRGHSGDLRPAFNTYGCNMTFRIGAIRDHGLRFDEQLPAYAWYEDIDFSRRLGAQDRAGVGQAPGLLAGRQSGLPVAQGLLSPRQHAAQHRPQLRHESCTQPQPGTLCGPTGSPARQPACVARSAERTHAPRPHRFHAIDT